MAIKSFDFDDIIVSGEKDIELELDGLNINEEVKFNPDFNIKGMNGFHPFVKFHAINSYYSKKGNNMESLMNDLGIVTRGSNMFCPFHPDDVTGKQSAKYHPETDTLYCFSESKVYYAYHVLKDLYGYDMDMVFKQIWNKLDSDIRDRLITEYNDEVGGGISEKKSMSAEPVWDDHLYVLTKFKDGDVNFRQHKNAMYKILCMIN